MANVRYLAYALGAGLTQPPSVTHPSWGVTADEPTGLQPLTCRWPDLGTNATIAVRVCGETLPLPVRALWLRLLQQALDTWTTASKGALLFNLLPVEDGLLADPQQAITLEWSNTPTLGRPYELGHTQRHLRLPVASQPHHTITHASITLLLAPPLDATLSPAQLQQRMLTTLLHELGHAVGLNHSVSPQSIMHHQGWQTPRLHPSDLQAIQGLYGV
jgi:hypothetical protein